MIVLKKDGHTTAPMDSVEDAKKMVSEGWKVWINKTGVKLDAKSLMKINREKFTLDKMTQKLDEIVEKHTKDLPSQVSIKLPKLKKVVETA